MFGRKLQAGASPQIAEIIPSPRTNPKHQKTSGVGHVGDHRSRLRRLCITFRRQSGLFRASLQGSAPKYLLWIDTALPWEQGAPFGWAGLQLPASGWSARRQMVTLSKLLRMVAMALIDAKGECPQSTQTLQFPLEQGGL